MGVARGVINAWTDLPRVCAHPLALTSTPSKMSAHPLKITAHPQTLQTSVKTLANITNLRENASIANVFTDVCNVC